MRSTSLWSSIHAALAGEIEPMIFATRHFRTRKVWSAIEPLTSARWTFGVGHCFMQAMQRPATTLTAFAICFGTSLLPEHAVAHGSERGFVMLLPTGYYAAGSALVVAASFLLFALAPAAGLMRLGRLRLALVSIPVPSRETTSLIVSVLLAGLVAIGFFATPDPLENLLPLSVWTMAWIGLPLLAALIGNIHGWINPFSGPLWLIRRLTGRPLGRQALARLPEGLGYGIAIAQYAAFAWFELISLKPDDPARLASMISLFWLFNLMMMVVYGQADWMRRAEPFSVFFRLIGLMAPIRWQRAKGRPGRMQAVLGLPGRAALDTPFLSPSAIAFAVLTLAAVSFDGFSKTFTWFELIGINPLDYHGRSQVQVENTIGLAMSAILLLALYLSTIFAGCGLAGQKSGQTVMRLSGIFIFSLLPISVAFHAAHYLTQLLVNGQYWLIALSDPFSTGTNLFGTANLYVTTSFLTNLTSVNRVWMTTTAVIVIGHVVGIGMAHALAVRHFSDTRRAVLSQVVLAMAMVLYTVFGLWLLATPTAG